MNTYVVDAIIDSGSSISIIRSSVVVNEACSPINEDVSKFCGINNSRLKILNIFYGEVEIQGVRTKIKFVGLANYFRRFIPRFSLLAKPLYELMKKNATFNVGIVENNPSEKANINSISNQY